MECAYCGRPIRLDAQSGDAKVYSHIDDDCVYCDPFDPTNKGVARPVGTLRS